MNKIQLLVVLVCAVMATPAIAQSKEHPKPKNLQVVDDVPAPPQVKDDPNFEAKVTTTKNGTDTIEEYRIKGKLYKMRVVPANGPAYFLVDAKGDGSFARVDGPDLKIAVPTWVLFEWK